MDLSSPSSQTASVLSQAQFDTGYLDYRNLGTPIGLEKALVPKEENIDLVVSSVIEAVSTASNVKIWVFLSPSTEMAIDKAQCYGLVKDRSRVKVVGCEASKGLDLVAAPLLSISTEDVVIVDGHTLSHIGGMGLTSLFIACVLSAKSVIFSQLSLGQKIGLVDQVSKMKKVAIWTMPKQINPGLDHPDVLVIEVPESVSNSQDEPRGLDLTSANDR